MRKRVLDKNAKTEAFLSGFDRFWFKMTSFCVFNQKSNDMCRLSKEMITIPFEIKRKIAQIYLNNQITNQIASEFRLQKMKDDYKDWCKAENLVQQTISQMYTFMVGKQMKYMIETLEDFIASGRAYRLPNLILDRRKRLHYLFLEPGASSEFKILAVITAKRKVDKKKGGSKGGSPSKQKKTENKEAAAGAQKKGGKKKMKRAESLLVENDDETMDDNAYIFKEIGLILHICLKVLIYYDQNNKAIPESLEDLFD